MSVVELFLGHLRRATRIKLEKGVWSERLDLGEIGCGVVLGNAVNGQRIGVAGR